MQTIIYRWINDKVLLYSTRNSIQYKNIKKNMYMHCTYMCVCVYIYIYISFCCMKENKVKVKVVQSCLILCNPMDYTVHGILQARILEWVAFPFSRGSRDRTQGSNPGLLPCRRIFYQLSHKGSSRILEWVAYPFFRGTSQSRNRTRVSCVTGRFFFFFF